jgi:hypothetical protein
MKDLCAEISELSASSKLKWLTAIVLSTIRGSLLCSPLMSVHISHTSALTAAAISDAV